MTATITLTQEQDVAVNAALSALNDGVEVFRIGGYAGTGKTTIAKWIIDNAEGAMVCAFTGKAAHRLRQKGLESAATIHSTIYNYDAGSQTFELKCHDEIYGDYFLIDEGSMVSSDLWTDILSFGLPVIMLGDPGQLQPVGNDPRLMHKPDVILRQIHRQAAESGIIRFATDTRQKRWTDPRELWAEDKVTMYPLYRDVELHFDELPTAEDCEWADIVICGYNRTRHKNNAWQRRHLGYEGLVYPGDQIIVIKNNRDLGVFNGQILTACSYPLAEEENTFELEVSNDGLPLIGRRIKFLKLGFGRNLTKDNFTKDTREAAIADYGYCITCHKSQGSEWDRVLVVDQQCSAWDATRWRYTAITRAAKELRYFFV